MNPPSRIFSLRHCGKGYAQYIHVCIHGSVWRYGCTIDSIWFPTKRKPFEKQFSCPIVDGQKIAFDIVDHMPQVTKFYKISVGISSVAGFCMFFPLLLGKWKTLRELLETIWSRGSKGIEAWFRFLGVFFQMDGWEDLHPPTILGSNTNSLNCTGLVMCRYMRLQAILLMVDNLHRWRCVKSFYKIQ